MAGVVPVWGSIVAVLISSRRLRNSMYFKLESGLGVVAYDFNPSTWEIEAGRSLVGLRPAWSGVQTCQGYIVRSYLKTKTKTKKSRLKNWTLLEMEPKALCMRDKYSVIETPAPCFRYFITCV